LAGQGSIYTEHVLSNQTQCKLVTVTYGVYMFTSSCGISFVDVRVLLVKTDDFRWISTEIINWWRSMPANIYLPCQLVICDTQLSIRCLRIKDKRGACLRKKRWVPRHGRFVLYPGQFNDLLLQLYSLNATCKSYTATTHTD
jgi:hypothetical protein